MIMVKLALFGHQHTPSPGHHPVIESLIRITKDRIRSDTSATCQDKETFILAMLIYPSVTPTEHPAVSFVFIRSIGWRLGLQALTGIVFSTFILGKLYFHHNLT